MTMRIPGTSLEAKPLSGAVPVAFLAVTREQWIDAALRPATPA